MLLQSLTFEDKRTGWKLEDLRLDRFNLLVGASGVGKTKILRAIETVRRIGRGDELRNLAGVKFEIRFEHGGRNYRWQMDAAQHEEPVGSTAVGAPPSKSSSPYILEELLECDGNKLVTRKEEEFLFREQRLPLLNRAESAVKLLDDSAIHMLREGFDQLFLVEEAGSPHDALSSFVLEGQFDIFKAFSGRLPANLLGSLVSNNAAAKAFLLKNYYPDQYESLKQEFVSIFPSIEDIDIVRTAPSVTFDAISGSPIRYCELMFRLKEQGVAQWIEASDFSGGMARTLAQLIELTLALPGTIVLVDEFENSLGVNCMGPVMDLFLSRANDLQFIITSHHPYIINNVPKEYWKIVQRKGSTVRVTPARDIRALQGASALDAFTRLINSREYEDGIS
jgi:hypothetical protein